MSDKRWWTQEEVTRITERIAELEADLRTANDAWDAEAIKNGRLEAENARLREVLRDIERKGHSDYHARGYSLANLAEEALAEKDDE
jgi:regulator of replication initiation timing